MCLIFCATKECAREYEWKAHRAKLKSKERARKKEEKKDGDGRRLRSGFDWGEPTLEAFTELGLSEEDSRREEQQ